MTNNDLDLIDCPMCGGTGEAFRFQCTSAAWSTEPPTEPGWHCIYDIGHDLPVIASVFLDHGTLQIRVWWTECDLASFVRSFADAKRKLYWLKIEKPEVPE